MTDFPSTDIARRMGRPPLSKESKITLTGVRLTNDVRDRIEVLVGKNQMAKFIRDAIDEKIERDEPK